MENETLKTEMSILDKAKTYLKITSVEMVNKANEFLRQVSALEKKITGK